MKLRIAVATALVLSSCGVLHAQETEVQRRACRPDVFRLCSKWIPDRDAITHCLNERFGQLSPQCRAVMDGTLK